MTRWWRRRTEREQNEAEQALADAQASHERAEQDLATQQAALPEARETRAALAAHNVSNHYDDLIARVARQAAARGT